MPAYSSNPGPGGDDMYADAPEAAPKGEAEDKGEGEETTIPKSICPGMKVGEEVVLKIVGELDNEWRVAYAPKEGSKEEEAGESPATEASESKGGGEMSGMMY